MSQFTPPPPEMNPYASPTYVNEAPPPVQPVVPMPVRFGEVYRATWQAFAPHWVGCICGMALCTIVMLGIMLGFQLVVLLLMVGTVRQVDVGPVTVEEEVGKEEAEYPFFLVQAGPAAEKFIAPEWQRDRREDEPVADGAIPPEWIGGRVEYRQSPSGPVFESPGPIQSLFASVGMLVIMALYTIVMLWLFAGLAKFFTHIARYAEVKFSLIFSGGSELLQLVLYYLLMGVVIVAILLVLLVVIGVPCGILAFALRSPVIFAGGLVLLYIVLLILTVYTMPGLWLVIARRLDAGSALVKTYQIARLNLGSIVLLLLWCTLLTLPASILMFVAAQLAEAKAFGSAAVCFLGYFVFVSLAGAYVFMCGNVFCMLATGESVSGNEEF